MEKKPLLSGESKAKFKALPPEQQKKALALVRHVAMKMGKK